MLNKQIIALLDFLILTTSATAQNWDIDLAKNINPTHPGSGYWKFTSASTYIFSAAIPVGLPATGFATNDPALKRKSL